jgi:hypothetical protein
MGKSSVLKIATFAFVVFLVWLLAWLTLTPEPDPCEGPDSDVSAAVIADQQGDQEALVNRAIIMRGKCERDTAEQEKTE